MTVTSIGGTPPLLMFHSLIVNFMECCQVGGRPPAQICLDGMRTQTPRPAISKIQRPIRGYTGSHICSTEGNRLGVLTGVPVGMTRKHQKEPRRQVGGEHRRVVVDDRKRREEEIDGVTERVQWAPSFDECKQRL